MGQVYISVSQPFLFQFIKSRCLYTLHCHFPAFFSAFVTSFSAVLTMLHFVFGAFITARLTNLGAERANFSGERGAA
jgi:hypothetical protein